VGGIRIGLIVVLLLATSPTAGASAVTPGQVAADSFGRSISGGWGVADHGGTWQIEGAASAFAVNSGVGIMDLAAPGTNLAASLAPRVLNTDLSTTVSLDRAPSGGAMWLFGELRRNGKSSYRIKVQLNPGGAVFVGASRVVNSTEVTIGAKVRVAGLDYRGTVVRIRGQVQGTSPSTLRIRAWAAGSAEPSTWPFAATDGTAGLQRTGTNGWRAYIARGASNTPVHVRVDDFVALNLDGSLPAPDPVFVGAGDIATCGSAGDEQTATLLDSIGGTVYTLGDNAYPNGTVAEFANCYAPSWGRRKAQTLPAPGNHEYDTANADGYFGYFGAAAGDPTKGYYSFDLGAWHVIVLNANCSFVSCAAGSAQEQWLQADLATHTNACTAALWHQPRFSSGNQHGNSTTVAPFWKDLYAADADLILNGHDHDYERFARQTPDQVADGARGIREFVVGTGGAGLGGFNAPQPNSQVRNATTKGVLKLTLHASSYEWSFVPVAGATFADSGSTACH
jgi:hypothetical protein